MTDIRLPGGVPPVGMTYRDWAAALVLAGLASNPDAFAGMNPDEAAETALEWADALAAVLREDHATRQRAGDEPAATPAG